MSRFVLALGLRIVVDRRANRGSGDWIFFLVIMWWLFLVDVTIIGGFWRHKFCFFSPLWWLFLVVVVGGGFGDLSYRFGAFFAGFFRGCSSGEVVGFGWWLCGVLGLFTAIREKGGRETETREMKYIILGNIFYCVDILF